MTSGGVADDPVIGLRDVHVRRLQRMLRVFSLVMVLVGAAWGLFFSLRGDWLLVLLDGVLIGCGIAGFVLSKRARTRSASLLLLGAVFLVVCVITAVFDVPSAQAPRASDHYLLALLAFSFVLLRGEPVWLQRGVAFAFCAMFVFFSSADFGFETSYALSDSIRVPGAWITNACVAGMLYLALHIMQTDVIAPVALQEELNQALSEGQFVLYFQPVMADADRVVGAEALVRWRHPTRGLMLPGEFVPVAEHSGLILALGEWGLEAACRQLVAWSAQTETRGLTVSVNISARQLHQPDFVARVLSIIDQTGADATRLKLEITESLLINDVEDIITKMTALKACGIGFSLDDFGTGFSSLSYLKRLPLDQLKIDRSFVRDVVHAEADAAIARTVIALGRNLKLAVVAEGVETEAQREFLSRQGCHFFQGYLFSPPLPADEMEGFARARLATRETTV